MKEKRLGRVEQEQDLKIENYEVHNAMADFSNQSTNGIESKVKLVKVEYDDNRTNHLVELVGFDDDARRTTTEPALKRAEIYKTNDPGHKRTDSSILGPCSYKDCEQSAYFRCFWKNTGCSVPPRCCKYRFRSIALCLSRGGCEKLFCISHAYMSDNAYSTYVCKRCSRDHKRDKTNYKWLCAMILSVIIVIVFSTTLLLVSRKEKESEL